MQVLFTPRFPIDTIPPSRDDVPEHARAAYRHARGRYIDRMGRLVAGGFRNEADVEDWHENVAWLLAAFDAGLNVHVIDRDAHQTGEVDPLYSHGLDFDPDRPTLLMGAQPRQSRLFGSDPTGRPAALDVVWPSPGHEAAAHAYALNPAFRARAGRRTAVCDLPGEGAAGDVVACGAEGELCRTLADWAQDGPVDALIKIVVQAKYASPEAIRLPAGADLEAARKAVFGALGYALMHLEGARAAVLLQDRVRMLDEYRVFVVDGVPVTGAGCIERFTPWDRAPGHVFDPRVEGLRGSGEIRADLDLTRAYRSFARESAAALVAADPDLGDFALDLAVGPDGAPLIVELNPLAASGLYACKIDALVKAIRDSRPRRCARLAA